MSLALLNPETLELVLRLGFFVGILSAMALWEILLPRRRLNVRKTIRWTSNLSLVILNSVAMRLMVPLGLSGIALFAESRSWGLLPLLRVPGWLEVILAIIALDLAVYLQHIMFHAVPFLWRFHMVHHADLDFDVSTGLRFHTIEIILSFGFKSAAVLLLGAPATAVLAFEILLNATAMFNHSNVRLPLRFERFLRLLVVTPDMHRVHHSVIQRETNSNFGFNLPWWDWLLGTYRDQPEKGHEQMEVGLSPFRDEKIVDRLPGMLMLPLHRNAGEDPLNREKFAKVPNE